MFFGNPELSAGFAILMIVISIWDLVWKAFGLWNSAKNNHFVWFIVILIFNTAGILPIIYLLWLRNKTPSNKKKK